MVEFQKVAKERKRMCEQYALCKYCPLGELQKYDNGKVMCGSLAFEHPQEAEKIIMQWAAENPAKTNAKKFVEVFGFVFDGRFLVDDAMREWLREEYNGNE